MMNKHTEKGFRSLLMTFTVGVMLLFSITAMAAPQAITGKVQDANGEPLIGASVLEKGTSNGTITDFEGVFTLNVETDVYMLHTLIKHKSGGKVTIFFLNTQYFSQKICIFMNPILNLYWK